MSARTRLSKSWTRTLPPRITDFARWVTGILNRPSVRHGSHGNALCRSAPRCTARRAESRANGPIGARPGTERTERNGGEPSVRSARNGRSPAPRRLKTSLGAEKLSKPVRGRENALSRAAPSRQRRHEPRPPAAPPAGPGARSGLPQPPLFAPSGGSAISNSGTDRRRPTRQGRGGPGRSAGRGGTGDAAGRGAPRGPVAADDGARGAERGGSAPAAP